MAPGGPGQVGEEVANLEVQRLGQVPQCVNGWVGNPALDLTDELVTHAGPGSQLTLRQSATTSQFPESRSEPLSQCQR